MPLRCASPVSLPRPHGPRLQCAFVFTQIMLRGDVWGHPVPGTVTVSAVTSAPHSSPQCRSSVAAVTHVSPHRAGSWLQLGGMGQLGGGRSQRKPAARGVREDRRAQEGHLAFVWRGRMAGRARLLLPSPAAASGKRGQHGPGLSPLLRCRRHRPRTVDSPSPPPAPQRAGSLGTQAPGQPPRGRPHIAHPSRAAFLTLNPDLHVAKAAPANPLFPWG